MFETSEPQSAVDILEELNHIRLSFDEYVSGIPIPALFRNNGEKWSPSDHVRHLSKSTFPLVKALTFPKIVLRILFGTARRSSRSFREIRSVYLDHLNRGANAGRFAPSRKPDPLDPGTRAREIIATWRKAASALETQIKKWRESDLDHYQLPHPLLGKLTVREMLFFSLYHYIHHMNAIAAQVSPTS